MQYLCKFHEQSAFACPITATHLWHMAFEAGNHAACKQNWRDACVGFGSSFDIACIMVEKHLAELGVRQAQWRLQVSCKNLVYVLQQMGKHKEAGKYLAWFDDWLCCEAGDNHSDIGSPVLH